MENSITNGKLVESIMEKSEANAWCMFVSVSEGFNIKIFIFKDIPDIPSTLL